MSKVENPVEDHVVRGFDHNNPSVNKARKLLADLELSIQASLSNFTKETGIDVTDIDLHFIDSAGYLPSYRIDIGTSLRT